MPTLGLLPLPAAVGARVRWRQRLERREDALVPAMACAPATQQGEGTVMPCGADQPPLT